jgi:quinolinate synthase
MPITYMNSTAELKAYCGERGGAVCTSSNCRALFEWAFAQRDQIFFFPDEHLGRNTAVSMGIPLDRIALWDPKREQGGLTEEALRRAKVILWKGCCSVHTTFHYRHVRERREEDPDVKILVHPEVPHEVAGAADFVGSTEYIIRTLREAPAGSSWAVGTEYHLVHRLANTLRDKKIVVLSKDFCMCATMYRISPQNLLWGYRSRPSTGPASRSIACFRCTRERVHGLRNRQGYLRGGEFLCRRLPRRLHQDRGGLERQRDEVVSDRRRGLRQLQRLPRGLPRRGGDPARLGLILSY